ncbi:MAG: hypothetical protein PVG79_02095 [Gemmatimonadales bacterium]|jgi:hypothetical protein
MSNKALQAARALILVGLAGALAVTTAEAQTPEGTTIRNIATATFTDANSNTYAAVADTVDITVGFQVGISVTPDGGSQNPASPSTGNTLTFTVQNVGNGVDTVQVAESITDPQSVISAITNYRWNATDYGTIAALNTALASYELTMGATTTIEVTYNVAADKGGESANYQLTATSVRDGGESDPGDYDINAGETYGVTVVETATGQDTAQVDRLPSNGTNYTVQFTVTNDGNGNENFVLLTTQNPGTAVSVVSMTGTGVSQGGNPDSAMVSNLGPSSSVDVTVTYSVADVAAGTVDTLIFTAYPENDPPTTDDARLEVRVVKPSLTILKEAYTDAGLTTLVSGDVLPGQSIWYKVTVSNASGATADAESIDIDDDLPTEVTYVNHGDDGSPGWSISYAAGPPEHIDATLTTLAPGASAYFWIEVTIN